MLHSLIAESPAIAGQADFQNGASVQSNEIRFKITADYSEVNSSTGIPVEIGGRAGSSKQRLNGMVFRPTVPFQWSSQGGAELIAAATN